MTEQNVGEINNAEMVEAIERHIVKRTGRCVHRLHVTVEGEHVVLRGWTPSWYMKQLALQAVREVLTSASVELCIQVSPGRWANEADCA